jgi:uncharacterized protein with HEPN domain
MNIKNRDRQIILALLNYIDGIYRTHTLFKNEKDIFLVNNDYQYSLAFAILQIGELVGNLDIEIKDKIKIKSLRNRIVHGYGSIDLDMLWEISHTNIKELRNELEQIIGL